MNPSEIVLWLLENSRTMVIATADNSGKPWVSPVFYSYDDDYNLYWVSDKNARHSVSIRDRPEVGVVIYGKVPPKDYSDAAYFDTVAIELTKKKDIDHAIAILAKRTQHEKFVIKSKDDVSGNACWRIYKAKPTEITKRDDAKDQLTGQAITIRMPVELS